MSVVTHELQNNLLARMAGAAQALDPAVGGVLVEGALLHVYSPDDATPESIKAAHADVLAVWHVERNRASDARKLYETAVEKLKRTRTPKSCAKQGEAVNAAVAAYHAACTRVDEIERRLEQLTKACSLAGVSL